MTDDDLWGSDLLKKPAGSTENPPEKKGGGPA